VPHTIANESSDRLDRVSRDRARVLLLESRSSLVSWGPYFWSICLRLFLCQVAAGENVVEVDGDGGGVKTSLLCGCCCFIFDDNEGVMSEDEDVISSKVLDGDDLNSVVTCFDLENEPIVVRLDGA